jgi:DNA modification methylase
MSIKIMNCDVLRGLRQLADESVNCCVTSPPYWGLRDYGVEGQIGLEPTPEAFVARMVEVFREVRRVLRADGSLWLNLGDSYAGGKGGNTNGGSSSGLKRDGRPEKGRMQTNVDFGEKMAAMDFKKPLPPGFKPKDLVGIPWMTAFALRADGWYLRQEIIWAKPNPMPESVQDRCTKAHEHLFLLSKSARYFYDADAIREDAAYPNGPNAPASIKSPYGQGFTREAKQRGHERSHDSFNGKWDAMTKAEQRANGRNKRSVWTMATTPYSEAHFATFPEELPETCIKAGCPVGGMVLDPFGGAGTTGLVADKLGRNAVLIELNPEYAEMAKKRIEGSCPMFANVAVGAT